MVNRGIKIFYKKRLLLVGQADKFLILRFLHAKQNTCVHKWEYSFQHKSRVGILYSTVLYSEEQHEVRCGCWSLENGCPCFWQNTNFIVDTALTKGSRTLRKNCSKRSWTMQMQQVWYTMRWMALRRPLLLEPLSMKSWLILGLARILSSSVEDFTVGKLMEWTWWTVSTWKWILCTPLQVIRSNGTWCPGKLNWLWAEIANDFGKQSSFGFLAATLVPATRFSWVERGLCA